MRAATTRPWVRRRLWEVLHLLRPPSALFGPGVLARVTWDRLAGKADSGNRNVTPLPERIEGSKRLPLRTPADLDVKIAAARRSGSEPSEAPSGRYIVYEARSQIGGLAPFRSRA
jgi:hypothetical protein